MDKAFINLCVMTKFTAYLILIVGNVFSSYSQFQNQGVVYSDELAEPVFYFSVDSAQCADSKDGSIVLWNENEFIDSIRWENGDTTFERDELSSGVYSMELYLNYGVMYQYEFLVNSPPVLESEIQLTELKNSFIIHAEVSGGISPYSYNWSNSIVTESFVTNTSGNYSLEISDKNGCQIHKSVTLSPNEISNDLSAEDFQIISAEPGSFTAILNELDFEFVCYAMNGKLVKPTIVEQNAVRFNQLSKGYYFLVGRIGEIEIKEKVFVF